MYNCYTDVFKTNHSMLCTWLPMSPYLKPYNYFFAEHIKDIVCITTIIINYRETKELAKLIIIDIEIYMKYIKCI